MEPAIPLGKTSTRIMKIHPRTSCQKLIREITSCNQVKAAEPAMGPNRESIPPKNSMKRKSKERGMAISSGKMLPLEKTYMPPASPANAPVMAKANH